MAEPEMTTVVRVQGRGGGGTATAMILGILGIALLLYYLGFTGF